MTNLKFINEQIECFKNNIKFFEDLLKRRENPLITRKEDDSKFDLLTINDLKIKIKDNYEMLNYCKKIKTVLEAWEIAVSKGVDLYDIINTADYKQYKSENNDLLKQYFLNEKEYEIIKKTLEVKENE